MTLTQVARRGVPCIHRHLDGAKILQDVAAIVATDRWNSFDQFHRTARYLRARYDAAGCRGESYAVPTGGPDGSGRWVVQQASDVLAATLDIVNPVRQRVVDFARNPWQVVQWSAATPRGGVESELIVMDDLEALRRLRAGALRGKWLLTQLSPWHRVQEFARTGVDGILVGARIGTGFGSPPRARQLPGATEWTKLGWSGMPMEHAGLSLVALAISGEEDRRVRALLARHGRLRVRARVDVRRYVGTHELVSGVVQGWGDPQDEVWAMAHSAEPGAADNASGVAVCVAVAAALESAIRAGELPRPRRSIRLLSGYECYGFFHSLEHGRRLQAPLAGVVVDTVGTDPRHCNGRWNWHGTLPASATFVNEVGASMIRAALRVDNPGYRLTPQPFMSTEDTLAGDPQYGFPCPWMNTHYKADRLAFDAYHTSADVPALLNTRGLRVVAAATAGYLYHLADADSRGMLAMARTHTAGTLRDLRQGQGRRDCAWAELRGAQHQVSLQRLQRWMWDGDRGALLGTLAAMSQAVRRAVAAYPRPRGGGSPRVAAAARQVVFRTRLLAPDVENMPGAVRARLQESRLDRRPLFWADGRRSLADIAALQAAESGKPVSIEQVLTYFEAMREIGFVALVPPSDMLSPSSLRRDLQALGVRAGMDVMVHSSLSRLGRVAGGAEAVIDALLAVVGRQGTVLMPSFNHGLSVVYNPRTTPTTNGAIPDAFWRRGDAKRSLHGTHAVAAVGKRSAAYVAGHLDAGIWEADSPIGRLVHGGGYVLGLGVTLESATAYHVAEVSVPCRCLSATGGRDVLITDAGERRDVPGLLWRRGDCPVAVSLMEPALERAGRLRRGRVGQADARLALARDVWATRRRQLLRVCPTCSIRPDPNWKVPCN